MERQNHDPLSEIRSQMVGDPRDPGVRGTQSDYHFRIRPVYTIPTDRQVRLIAPGMTSTADIEEGRPTSELSGYDPGNWELSDALLQLIWTPLANVETESTWGLGPQFSLRPGSSGRKAGPGRGAGLVGMAFGSTAQFSYGGIARHHWGEDSYRLTTLQPIVFYNIDAAPGAYVGYSNTITYRWNTDAGDHWQIPLGLTLGRTLSLGHSGSELDLSLGGYGLVSDKSEGRPDWQLKLGISLFFP